MKLFFWLFCLLLSFVVYTKNAFQLVLLLISLVFFLICWSHSLLIAHWKLYFIVLVYTGGLFILFLYTTSVSGEKSFYWRNSMMLFMFMFFISIKMNPVFTMNNYVNLYGFELLLKFFNLFLMILLLSFLLNILFVISIVISFFHQPMRSLYEKKFFLQKLFSSSY